MVTIKLHNTKTRTKAVFTPIDATNVRMYVCGPTVYDRAHLGNARPVVVFDVLYRLLRHVAKENGWGKVTYVRNFTDVDDKINATALARKAAGDPRSLEALIRERTEQTIGWYHADMDALGALRPDAEPRATEYVPQMVVMIEGLIASGHAYEKAGHVLFRVRSYKDYGALSGRSIDDMIAGARVEVAPFKEDPMDFVLWKPSDADLPGWDSPWGKGRPGWHIECSAMSYELLGGSFDIHGGGLDLQFPHHENELAQSTCAHPDEGFAKVWMHNEMLQVEGKKMSKSLGNFFTVRDLLDQGIPGEVIRFVLLSTHYSKPMDWTERKRTEAEKTLRDYYRVLVSLDYSNETVNALKARGEWLVSDRVVQVLADDLNTHQALVEIAVLGSTGKMPELAASLEFLGLVNDWNNLAYLATVGVGPHSNFNLDALADLLRDARSVAMSTQNFSKVDQLKASLVSAGVEVRMSKDGVFLLPGPDFDPSKLDALK